MNFQQFYLDVAESALLLGYSANQISMFKGDIQDCYDLGMSVEETVGKIF